MDPIRQRLKTHSRTLDLDGANYTVLSPRPTVEARFATKRSRGSWHLVTDVSGAHLMARLCWAMAFQRHPRTITVIDQSFLMPNPLDATPSLPVAIVNSDLGTVSHEAVAALHRNLPFTGPSNGTVVLQTRGLDLALADLDAFTSSDDQTPWRERHGPQRWIEESGGVLVLAAPPPILRAWGVELSRPDRTTGDGTSPSSVDDPTHEGEVLADFVERVPSTVAARSEPFRG